MEWQYVVMLAGRSVSLHLLFFDQAFTNPALSFNVNPTLLTLPSRARASPTLSKTLLSSEFGSPGLISVKVSVLLVIAESSPRVSRKLVKYLSFFSVADIASLALAVL